MQNDLVSYYAARAAEYEKLYEKPERQKDLIRLTAILQDIFRGQNMLEIACGTGWWTQRLALTAQSVLATDINESMLDIARNKYYARNNITFIRDDIFQSALDQTVEGLFGGFIWSHIPLDQLDGFLTQIRNRVQTGGAIVFIDNLYVPGSSTPVSHSDEGGNTYQTRHLSDGSEHRVLKNFPAPDFLAEKLTTPGNDFEYRALDYYWLAIVKAGAVGPSKPSKPFLNPLNLF
ncbi:MAG: class I SAM-dependent methyltransferase [Thermoanaerobaculia bacterium]|nr:class I SAM-dependent methyltransferase [Thermoanaerobaculia bacterium]